MLNLLKELCALPGPSGREEKVREYIKDKIAPFADELIEDTMGNLLVFKKGQRNPGQRIMLAAHMDEVGMIVTAVNEDGTLQFDFIGGVDRRVVIGKRIVLADQQIAGVIGIKAIHLATPEERNTIPKLKDLYMDIGASSREEAEKLVAPGDCATFDPSTEVFGHQMLKAKALDDRIGCAVMVRLLQSALPVDLWCAFTVQEEVGCRGAATAAYRIEPELSIILEGTTAADLPSQKGGDKVCVPGRGPVIPFMDGGAVYDRRMFAQLGELAEKNKIPWQTKTMIAGGTDAQVIQKSRAGVRVATLSAALRYIHSPSSVVSIDDIEQIYRLLLSYLQTLYEVTGINRLAISPHILELSRRAMDRIQTVFQGIDEISENNTEKVLAAFHKNRVSDSLFGGTTGYGYDDKGRDVLDRIYADVFGAEAGLVRIGFVNGTHALTAAIFACLKPDDILLSATGEPYDTLKGAIGIGSEPHGSLKYYGIRYDQVDLDASGLPDLKNIARIASQEKVKAVLMQRSRGYSQRPALTIEQISGIIRCVKSANPNAAVVVDNCYGEFVEELEPTQVGADLAAGSLIKNPGGGLAPTGGYIVGRADLVEAASYHLTVPGIGGECGPTLGHNRLLYQGLFLAPHTVAQALKTAVFAASLLELMGYETYPSFLSRRADIIQSIDFGDPELLKRFCAGIQRGAPVDSFVTPEPWDMPGYDCKVIMAAGAFIQGASIELSADAPMIEPYRVYLQGALTFESGKLGIMQAASLLP
jgi:cystathionine beta-lyase family protein involved in aluminum resistance